MRQSNQSMKSIRRLLQALRYSLQGLQAAMKYEVAFRQEVILLVIVLCIAFFGSFSMLQRLGLIIPVLLLLIVELLNSAIEAIVDRISLEHHELAGRAKDLGSAAVLITLILVIICWVTVFLSKLSLC